MVVTAEDVAAWVKAKLLDQTPVTAPRPHPMTKAYSTKPADGYKVVKPRFWVVPASSHRDVTATESLHYWLDRGMWGFYESTPLRTALDPGDSVAFYATGTGVVAHARVAAKAMTLVQPSEWPEPNPQTKQVYKLPLVNVTWLEKPVEITQTVRAGLEAFQGKSRTSSWSWLVQTTRLLAEGDFLQLIGSPPGV